jgi:hypothetical protein
MFHTESFSSLLCRGPIHKLLTIITVIGKSLLEGSTFGKVDPGDAVQLCGEEVSYDFARIRMGR